MVKDLVFNKLNITLLFFSINFLLAHAQIEDDNYGFVFGIETYTLFPNEESLSTTYETDYELNNDSYLLGVSLAANYHFNSYLFASMNLGIDKLSQPNFIYYPLSFGLGVTSLDSDEFFLAQANIGIHLGDVDSNGFMIRGKVGYGSWIFKKMYINTGLFYSGQNIFFTFENSDRPDNYYNLEGIGLFININWDNTKN